MDTKVKTCVGCKKTKELGEFYRTRKDIDRHKSQCKACSRIKDRENYAKHRVITEKPPSKGRSPEQRRYANLKRMYGITKEEYIEIANNQDNKCKICKGKPGKRVSYLSVDHCHTTGKIRGLLCRKCNMAIGLLNDSIELLGLAKSYLEDNNV